MEKYDYQAAVSEDIREYLKSNNIVVTTANRKELEDKLSDDLEQEDSVTGNASGSYTCNYWRAEENICHNLDLLQDAADAYGCDLGEWIKSGAETCDVVIRCYLVSSCLSDVLDKVQIEDYLCIDNSIESIDLSKDSNIYHTDSEGELQEKVIALFKEKYSVQCRKINKEHYSVIFPSTEEYLKFKNYALELAKPFYIFESDVLSVIRIQNTYDGIVELYPLNSFDITSVLAKILGLRTDY